MVVKITVVAKQQFLCRIILFNKLFKVRDYFVGKTYVKLNISIQTSFIPINLQLLLRCNGYLPTIAKKHLQDMSAISQLHKFPSG